MNLPFVTGYAEQFYLDAEAGLEQAKEDKSDYWYIDGSFPSDYTDQWSTQRIDNLVKKIETYQVKPIYHGNFKLPLASDVENIRELAVKNVLAEIDLSSALSAPLIVHGGVIVEPRLVIKAKKEALENYLRTVNTIADYAEKKGVTILLENLSNYKIIDLFIIFLLLQKNMNMFFPESIIITYFYFLM